MTYKPATLALHGGQAPDPTTGARAVPIYATTSYAFNSSDHAANLFALKEFGNIYSRIQNPTQAVAEDRLALLEGAASPKACLLASSGQAAITLATLTITKTGQNIVASSSLYGGTYNLFHYTFAKLGIDVRFVDSSSPKNFANAIDSNTRLLYAETMGNPKNDMLDIKAVADIAHSHKIPLFIDNTVATPILCRPFDHGADIVIYSTTKFLGGHGTVIGGAIIEGGRFDWANGKFPELTEPDESYHGAKYWEAFGNHSAAVSPNTAFIIKARVQMMRDLGPCPSPFNAFLLIQGLETLHLRMPRHCENAMAVAQWMEKNPLVAWVNYPGLPNHPSHQLTKKYYQNGFGAMIGFGVKGGYKACVRAIDHVKLVSHLANIGDAKTLIIHPASTTHQQMSESAQLATGVTPDYLRLSVGIEDVSDIIADLDQAIRAAQ